MDLSGSQAPVHRSPSPSILGDPSTVTMHETPASPHPCAQAGHPMDLSGSNNPVLPASSPSPSGDPPKVTVPFPMQVHLSSCIPVASPIESPGDPIPLHARRDLSQFIVDDNSSPTSRSLCSEGRDLSVISNSNFPRGGHRLDPATSPSAKGGRLPSNQAPKGPPVSGKSDAHLSSPLHETAPLLSPSLPAGPIPGGPKGSLYGKISGLLLKGEKSKPKGEIHVSGKGENQVPRKRTNGKPKNE